jgi:hypothetical protein
MNADLHCHSTASDGTLSPAALAERAQANGVTLWSLTDHDVLDAQAQAREAANDLGIRYVPGVEVSVTWQFQTVHIVGLGVDPSSAELEAGLASVRSSRQRRAERIAARLAEAGIDGTLEGAYRYAENPELIGRTHFARYLAAAGHAEDTNAVFQRYLSAGRPGYVPHEWAMLDDAVRWIRASGGLAVIAHPGRYKLSRDQLLALLAQFKATGGTAIEVVTGSHALDRVDDFAFLARSHGLLASCGSDFHEPGEGRFDLGSVPSLPDFVTPIWSALP